MEQCLPRKSVKFCNKYNIISKSGKKFHFLAKYELKQCCKTSFRRLKPTYPCFVNLSNILEDKAICEKYHLEMELLPMTTIAEKRIIESTDSKIIISVIRGNRTKYRRKWNSGSHLPFDICNFSRITSDNCIFDGWHKNWCMTCPLNSQSDTNLNVQYIERNNIPVWSNIVSQSNINSCASVNNLNENRENGNSTHSSSSKPVIVTRWLPAKRPPTRQLSVNHSVSPTRSSSPSTQSPPSRQLCLNHAVFPAHSSSSSAQSPSTRELPGNRPFSPSRSSSPSTQRPPTKKLCANRSVSPSSSSTYARDTFKMPGMLSKPSGKQFPTFSNYQEPDVDDSISIFTESIRSEVINLRKEPAKITLLDLNKQQPDKRFMTANWLMQNAAPPVYELKKKHNSATEIPVIYSNLCRSLFENRACKQDGCNYLHCIDDNIDKWLSLQPLDKLKSNYNYVKQFPKLFFASFAYFAKYLVRLEREIDFMMIVDDILGIDMLEDKTRYLRSVITCLMTKDPNSKLTDFEEAVKTIISVHGTVKNGLGDMLLTLVLEKNHLVEYWDLISLLTQLRVDEIDHGAVEDMMKQLVAIEPVDFDMINKMADFMARVPKATVDRIDPAVLNRYKTLTGAGGLSALDANGVHETREKHCSSAAPVYVNDAACYSPNFIDALLNQYTNCAAPAAVETNGGPSQCATRNGFAAPAAAGGAGAGAVAAGGGAQSCAPPRNDVANLNTLHSLICEKRYAEMSQSLLQVYKNYGLRKQFVVRSLNTFRAEYVNAADIFLDVVNRAETQMRELSYDEDWQKMKQFWGMNVIILLFVRNHFQSALTVINYLPDPPNFVNVEIVEKSSAFNFSEYKYQYLFCIVIFVRNFKWRQAYNLIVNNDYKILFRHEGTPSAARTSLNLIVTDFIKEVVHNDMAVASEFLRYLISNKKDIAGFAEYCNQLLYRMLQENSADSVAHLKTIAENQMGEWYRSLLPPVFRAYVILMIMHEQKVCIPLYHLSCEIGCYDAVEVVAATNVIHLKTNLSTEEIFIILHIFLTRLSRLTDQGRDIFVQLTHVAGQQNGKWVPELITRIDTSNRAMCARVGDALVRLNPPLQPKSFDTNCKYVVIGKESVRSHLLQQIRHRQTQ